MIRFVHALAKPRAAAVLASPAVRHIKLMMETLQAVVTTRYTGNNIIDKQRECVCEQKKKRSYTQYKQQPRRGRHANVPPSGGTHTPRSECGFLIRINGASWCYLMTDPARQKTHAQSAVAVAASAAAAAQGSARQHVNILRVLLSRTGRVTRATRTILMKERTHASISTTHRNIHKYHATTTLHSAM